MNGTPPPEAAAIIEFWREAGPNRWYAKDEAFDREIADRFGDAHGAASSGENSAWAETPEGALALLLLLDQFSRNMFRGTAQAFAQDSAALRIAEDAIARGFDRQVDPAFRAFFYVPFMHSEWIADQERCVALCHSLPTPENLPFAREHERIIRRFGRFPHRNAILARRTSPAEQAFLDAGGFAG